MSNESRRLVKYFNEMNEQQKNSLLDYARYLRQQNSPGSPSTEQQKHQPLESPRPENENVVNAIKRLRVSYFMLNTDVLLNESSALMAQFMIQGRDAKEVIDDLEILFENQYQKYLQS